MKMQPDDYSIYSITTEGAFVVSTFGSLGSQWPPIINDEKSGKKFRFICNEVMPSWMAGKWGGFAKYEEVK